MRRTFEAVLFVLSFLWLVFPIIRWVLQASTPALAGTDGDDAFSRLAAIFSTVYGVILVLHLIVERPNWQGTICYIVCACAILSIFVPPSPTWLSATARVLGVVLLLAFAALWILLPVPKLQPVRRAIGVREWKFDASETLASRRANPERQYLTSRGVPEIPDRLRVRVWYPTDAKSGVRAPYLEATSLAAMMDIFFGLQPGTWPHRVLSIVSSHVPLALSNAFLNAPICSSQQKWPLLVLSHGLKGAPEIYTAMGEQLASLGYIVAAPVHTDGSAGERFKGFYPFEKPVVNAQLAERARDVSFTVDQLQNESEITDRIDWDCISICGHSFGGVTAIKVLQTDDRFLTGVGWDTWAWPLTEENELNVKFDRSLLFVQSDWFLVGEGREENIDSITRVCKNAKRGGYLLQVSETAHHNYNDLPLFASPHLIRYIRAKMDPPRLFGASDGHLVHSFTAEATHTFVQWQLRGSREPAPALFSDREMDADVQLQKPSTAASSTATPEPGSSPVFGRATHSWRQIHLHLQSFNHPSFQNNSSRSR